MPKSARSKAVSLTKTKAHGREHKEKLAVLVRKYIDEYDNVYYLSIENMRNKLLKDLRQEWQESRLLYGKNKVMAIALGTNKESEYQPNLHQISERIRGQSVFLFTNVPEDDVIRWFAKHEEMDYARSGNKALYTVILEAGPVPSFSHSIEPQLRQLGLPTTLEKGVITLLKAYTVCKQGDVLKPEQARILKLFGHKMAKFRVLVDAMWSKKTSIFKIFDLAKQMSSKNVKVVNIRGEDLKPSGTTEVDMKSDDDGDDKDNNDVDGGGDNDVDDGDNDD